MISTTRGTNSQGSIDANGELWRNQVGNVATRRHTDHNQRGAAHYCDAQEESMTFTELLRNVGLFGAAVMCCLGALSIFSVAVIVDKHRRFRTAMRQSQVFKPMFTKFLHGGEVQELIDAVRQHENSHVAQVVSAGILEYDGVRQAGGDPVASLELVTSALRDSISETLIQLKRGLGFLAVVAFNHFTGRIETFQVQMNRASSQLVNCLFKVPQVTERELRDPQVVEQEVKVALEAKAYAAR